MGGRADRKGRRGRPESAFAGSARALVHRMRQRQLRVLGALPGPGWRLNDPVLPRTGCLVIRTCPSKGAWAGGGKGRGPVRVRDQTQRAPKHMRAHATIFALHSCSPRRRGLGCPKPGHLAAFCLCQSHTQATMGYGQGRRWSLPWAGGGRPATAALNSMLLVVAVRFVSSMGERGSCSRARRPTPCKGEWTPCDALCCPARAWDQLGPAGPAGRRGERDGR